MISATVIADSLSAENIRLLTFKLRYPWFIHGELMTHRVFSRNASSNRAIPLAKMLEEARRDDLRAEPVFWGAEQKGMSPGGELSDVFLPGEIKSAKWCCQEAWRQAAFAAAEQAETMHRYGLHKSLCNRLLMPFTHANVVVTATEWENFFGLRLAADADPTMRALAEAMRDARAVSAPTLLRPGQWHLPFASDEKTWNEIESVTGRLVDDDPDQTVIKVSVARCARVSYESFPTTLPDGTVVPGKRSTVEEDLRLYEKLQKDRHWSAFEHQATPLPEKRFNIFDLEYETALEQQGNFEGWRQYRKMMPDENL